MCLTAFNNISWGKQIVICGKTNALKRYNKQNKKNGKNNAFWY